MSTNLFAEDIPLEEKKPIGSNTGLKNDREFIIEPRASIDDGVVIIATDVATWGVTVTVYDAVGVVVYTSVSMNEGMSHEFIVGELPVGDYTIEVLLGEDQYEGDFTI